MRTVMILTVFLALTSTASAQFQPIQPIPPLPTFQPFQPQPRQPQPVPPAVFDAYDPQGPLADFWRKQERERRGYEEMRRQSRHEERMRTQWNNCMYGRGDVNLCPR